MPYSRSHLFWLFITCQGLLFPQTMVEPSRMRQFNITINFDEYTVKTQMLSQNKSICVNNERTYLWYSAQKLIETKGGYDGRLIHGTYRAFYLNNQLKEQGEVSYGLRNRQWKYWYPDGRLKEVITWKKGVKQGAYWLYNDYGQLMAKGRFKKDKLQGRFYTYGPNGKVVDQKRYRAGEEQAPRVRTKRTKKEKPAFRKKEQEPVRDKMPTVKKNFFQRLFKKSSKKVGEQKTLKREEKKRSVTT